MRTTDEYIRHALKKLRTLEGFENVRFIVPYGSVAEGRATETSDIDLCIYYAGTREEGQQFRFVRPSPNSVMTGMISRSSGICLSTSKRK
ncbi:nucleotidyltransferase domain-containing protein [Methanogenium sp. MK-MG]|uniref:nucleotidyltransferase domain-containing protein n=1 Tax=Methanogenium sp. MK-MG TaxID=2599926 RepID=UPI0020B11A30|nr:nucleotidyltransferase domain-containing protein [Methanogenium sp. MK-MG]KAF1078012.1 hypothetical protein MKMG_01053 [Methanogenium sp. MK-MG]